MQKVTTVLNVKKTQGQLEFPDIVTSGADNRLFVDALLVAINKDELSKKAHKRFTDFFQTVFNLVREGKAKEQELLDILSNSKENNGFRLGKSEVKANSYATGRGCGPDMLFKLLTRVEHRRLIQNGTINDPMGIVLYIQNFSEDRMSDLLISLIFDLLCEFTEQQALLHDPNAKFVECSGLCWDLESQDWVEFKYNQLLDSKGVSLSLVPKNIVTDQYRYQADNYLMAHLIQYEQEEELKADLKKDPDAVKRNKKLIRKEVQEESGNLSTKDLLIQLTLTHHTKNPMGDYKNAVMKKYNGGLSDSELTSIIEKPYSDIKKGLA